MHNNKLHIAPSLKIYANHCDCHMKLPNCLRPNRRKKPNPFRSIFEQDTRETFNEKFQSSAFSIHDSSSILSIKQATEIAFQQCDPPTVPPDVALFNELNTAGSLFSIHSAPPVQQATDSINAPATEISAVSSDGNGLLQQNLSTKSVFLELIANNKRTSECDEDDNDNLLTVSSVTARPLIHELKSNR